MYHKMAVAITEKFVDLNIIEKNKADIYKYGFEMMISNFVYILIFIATSLITETMLSSFLFWVGLFIVRKLAGGHHANSYISCHILFFANHLLFIVLEKVYPNTLTQVTATVFLFFSALAILIFAPVDHKNKPFIKTEYSRFRKASCIYSCIIILIALLCAFTHVGKSNLTFAYTFGTFSATISLLCGKLINYIERRNKK